MEEGALVRIRRSHAALLPSVPLLGCLLILALGAFTACRPAPRRADLIVGVEQEPASLDPRLGSDVAADRAFRLLYRGLFTIGPDFRPVPDLVETWTQADPTHYRFTLKRGVRFSDGREVTARDVVYTLESIRRPDVPSFRKGDLDRVSELSAPSRYEVRATLREPYATFLSSLNVGIVPEGTPPGAAPPVGCGAYRLRSWERGQWLLFEANPYAAIAPRSRTLAFKIIPDPVVRALEMRRGSVDLVVNDLPPDTLSYFANHGYPCIRGPGSNYAYVGLNCARPPLDRREVRQALAMAVDRPAVLANVVRGFGRLASGLLAPEHWAYNGQVARWPHDPARAARMLESAGLRAGPDGLRFRLTYKLSENKVSRQIATAFAQDLAGIGVRADLQTLEWGTFYGDVKRGDFDCFGLTWVGVTDPDGFRLRYSSLALPPEGFNRGRYVNPEVDRLVEEGARAGNLERRRALYGRVQAILAEDVPCISLWWPDNVAVTQRDVSGVVLPPDANFSFLAGVSRKP